MQAMIIRLRWAQGIGVSPSENWRKVIFNLTFQVYISIFCTTK
jgi:hypothetical protein